MNDPIGNDSEPFEIGSSIPVLRMLDEAQSKKFYLDFLGYQTDWEHRFNDDPSSPLYMQIRRGDSVLHLNGHANEQSPTCEVRIPVKGLQQFCDHLHAKQHPFGQPELVDPRYEGRKTDMNLVDPAGNYVVYWTPAELAGE